MNFDTNVQTDVIFLDFAESFDKVPHKRLILKLLQLIALNSHVLRWIDAFSIPHEQFVISNGVTSNRSPVSSGVLTRSPLGPLFVIIYINDLLMSVSLQIRLLADDRLCYCEGTNPHDQVAQRRDLSSIQN